MGMSAFYGPGDDEESIATIHRALELGITFLDTAELYGRGANEELVFTVAADESHGDLRVSKKATNDVWNGLRSIARTTFETSFETTSYRDSSYTMP